MWKKSKICKVRRNAPRDFLHFGKVKRRVEAGAREAKGEGARAPQSEPFSERANGGTPRRPKQRSPLQRVNDEEQIYRAE